MSVSILAIDTRVCTFVAVKVSIFAVFSPTFRSSSMIRYPYNVDIDENVVTKDMIPIAIDQAFFVRNSCIYYVTPITLLVFATVFAKYVLIPEDCVMPTQVFTLEGPAEAA